MSSDAQPRPCFEPGPPLCGELRVPGSKSIAQREHLLAACSPCPAEVRGGGDALDTLASLAIARALGCTSSLLPGGTGLPDGTGLPGGIVRRLEPRSAEPGGDLDPGESATAARLGLALAALGTPRGTRYQLRPSGSLRERDSPALLLALQRAGVELRSSGRAPLELEFESLGRAARELTLEHPSSSQEVSALVLALAAGGGGTLDVLGPIPSPAYVTLTLELLAQRLDLCGVECRTNDLFRRLPDRRIRFSIPALPLDPPAASLQVTVEPDASCAALAWSAACLTGGRIQVPGLHPSSSQADICALDYLQRFGAECEWDDSGAAVGGRARQAVELSFANCPDLAPALLAVAVDVALRVPGSAGRSEFTGLETLPGKESSRIDVLGAGLLELGLAVEWDDASLRVAGPPSSPDARPVVLDACGDHRMVFAFALISLVRPGIRVLGTEAVAKSWPSFFSDFENLGARRPAR